MAAAKGVSNATLAYAWLLHKGVTAPIVGCSKTTQLDQAERVGGAHLGRPDHPDVVVPKVHHSLSTRRVLTTELVR